MGQIVGVRLGAELRAKLDALCESTQQRKSDVLRQVLQVVSVEQLRHASQELRVEQAECELP
jgi:predicted transcriptional regulator